MIAGSWLCLLSPLAGVLVITLAGTAISRRVAGVLATLSTTVALAGAVWAFFDLVSKSGAARSQGDTSWTWLGAGGLHFGLSILVDPLSVFMMLIVSGVGSLIVGYSLGYMDGEDEERRARA